MDMEKDYATAFPNLDGLKSQLDTCIRPGSHAVCKPVLHSTKRIFFPSR